MKPLFHANMVNGPFDDPVLYVDFMFQKRAILFDLGDISKLSPRSILKISDVFVTHTHMDHFIGFDHLVRLLLGRDKTLSIYGPSGITESVQGRLSGYNWNLVGNYRYPFLLKVIEINGNDRNETLLVCRNKFAPENPTKKLAISENTFICKEDQFTVKAVELDHKITSMAYLLEEHFHLNVNKEKLKELGVEVGPWLNDLKSSVYSNKSDDYSIKVPAKERQVAATKWSYRSGELTASKKNNSLPPNSIKEYRVGRLKEEILITTPGQKIGYVVDCDYTPENRKKIISLMRGVDILYIEASFLDTDKEKARETAHLTAREAGELAYEAGAKKIQVIHFSHKYSGNEELLIEEAQKAFSQGSVAGDQGKGQGSRHKGRGQENK